MRHRGCVFRPSSGTPAPAITSLNYDQGDVAGGGQSIVITGTDLSSASNVSFGGTSATITGNTSTTVTVTLPTKTAGATTVSVTTPGGTSGTLAFEFWAPSTEASCTQFNDSISNAYSATGDGSWAARTGSTLVSGAIGTPTATSGRPTGDGSTANGLETPTAYTLFDTSGGSKGTFIAVANVSAPAAPDASPFNDAAVLSKTGDGTFGLGFNNSGANAYMFDSALGGYRQKSQTMAAGLHSMQMRFQDGTGLGCKVDSGSWPSDATLTTASFSNVKCNLLLGWSGTIGALNGQLYAIAFFNVRISDGVSTKVSKWAQQRFGVT